MLPFFVFSITRVVSEQSVLKHAKAINLFPNAIRMISYSMLLIRIYNLYLQKHK